MATTLIRNGKVWDGEQFFFADVLADGSQIVKIEPNITDPATRVYDATGQIVLPGLVDIHVHIKGVSPALYAIDPHMSSFPFGVTAVNDAGSTRGDRAFLDSLSLKTTVFAFGEVENNQPRLDLTEKYLAQYGDKALGIKVYYDTAAGAQDITCLQEICAFAQDRGLKVMVHSTRSPSSMKQIVETLSSGDILSHVYHGGRNSCVENDFEALHLAREKGVLLDSAFAGSFHTSFKNARLAIEAGFLPDTISTDITCGSGFIRGGRYGMTMCLSMARELGMEEADIFRAATSGAAKALGKEAEWGYLKVGRPADIAVLEYTNEAFSLTDRDGISLESPTGYRCKFTLADGQILFRD